MISKGRSKQIFIWFFLSSIPLAISFLYFSSIVKLLISKYGIEQVDEWIKMSLWKLFDTQLGLMDVIALKITIILLIGMFVHFFLCFIFCAFIPFSSSEIRDVRKLSNYLFFKEDSSKDLVSEESEPGAD